MLDSETLTALYKEYNDAVFKESAIREASFLPITYNLCGVEVKQFTPYHYLLADFAKSPFIGKSDTIAEEDVVQFLWIVSVDFVEANEVAKKEFIKRVLTTITDVDKLIREIDQYVSDALFDLPKEVKDNEKNDSIKVPSIAWVTGYIDSIASEYGWSEEKILHMPFARLIQYNKAIAMRRYAMAGRSPDSYNNLSDPIKWKIRRLIKESEDKAKAKE